MIFHLLVLPLLTTFWAEFAGYVLFSTRTVPGCRLFWAFGTTFRTKFSGKALLATGAIPGLWLFHYRAWTSTLWAKFSGKALLAAGAIPGFHRLHHWAQTSALRAELSGKTLLTTGAIPGIGDSIVHALSHLCGCLGQRLHCLFCHTHNAAHCAKANSKAGNISNTATAAA